MDIPKRQFPIKSLIFLKSNCHAKIAPDTGLKDHDRWLMARSLLARKLERRRSTSSLPALVDYVMSRPLVSAGMIAAELGISARAAQNLVAELGLREATGRGRYRAWGIL